MAYWVFTEQQLEDAMRDWAKHVKRPMDMLLDHHGEDPDGDAKIARGLVRDFLQSQPVVDRRMRLEADQ